MSCLKDIVKTEWDTALDTGKEVRLPVLADAIIENHVDALEEEKNRLFRNAVMDILRGIAKGTADDSGQLELFGFPTVIAIPDGDDYVYLRATNATFGKLQAGCEIRRKNVVRAQSKLDGYLLALRRVKPLMEGTEKTLMEAVQLSA